MNSKNLDIGFGFNEREVEKNSIVKINFEN